MTEASKLIGLTELLQSLLLFGTIYLIKLLMGLVNRMTKVEGTVEDHERMLKKAVEEHERTLKKHDEAITHIDDRCFKHIAGSHAPARERSRESE